MTAFAVYYTEFGFAAAADGLQRWGHQPTRDARLREKENSNVQKIFKFQRNGIEMVYALCGDVANEDRSFDLEKIMTEELKHIDTSALQNCYQLVEVLAEHVQQHLKRSRQRPVADVPFFGYFRSQPSWVEINFRPQRSLVDRRYGLQEYLPDGPEIILPDSLRPYLPDAAGNVSKRRDPRFPILWSALGPTRRSLDEAVDFVIEYVKESERAEIAEVGPDQATIGGHIHAAVVCPDSGFEWRVPPL
jgi:hypothetical protein